MRKLWLLFAQSTTVALGVLFIITLFKPDLLRQSPQQAELTIKQAQQSTTSGHAPSDSFAPAATRVIPAVVNVFTRQQIRNPAHPALQDPVFRYFFGDRLDSIHAHNHEVRLDAFRVVFTIVVLTRGSSGKFQVDFA